ncbi:MAG: hypothetical protein KGN80_09005, partial [Acidobacteriota bacterium]|nr:hypothetical protein [Acidobacteriota bacterium]
MQPPNEPTPSPHVTAKFSVQEILARLEEGRVYVRRTEDGSTLETAHAGTPAVERRHARVGGVPKERRTFAPLEVPTLFP